MTGKIRKKTKTHQKSKTEREREELKNKKKRQKHECVISLLLNLQQHTKGQSKTRKRYIAKRCHYMTAIERKI